DECDAVVAGDGAERACRRRRREERLRPDEFTARMHGELFDRLRAAIGEPGATDFRALSRKRERAAKITPPSAVDAREIHGAREVAAEERIAYRDADVDGDVPLTFGRRRAEVGRKQDILH